jgi:hypothetical protein
VDQQHRRALADIPVCHPFAVQFDVIQLGHVTILAIITDQ